MIELWNNPSGEIRLSTLPENPNTSRYFPSIDTYKIDELKENIRSLKSQIETVRSCMYIEFLQIYFYVLWITKKN